MQFTAIAAAPLPDIATARPNFDLHDLSDEDVAKVLFHRRKQCARGDAESLAWDQMLFGAISLVQVCDSDIHIESATLREESELELIDRVFRAMQDAPPLITWSGSSSFVPLLQFRCMKHRRSASDYWIRYEDRRDPHVDLQRELLPDNDAEMPSLDELTRRLGLPGMLGRDTGRLWESWLEDDQEALAAFADYQAINTALLGFEIFHLKGRCSTPELGDLRNQLLSVITRAQPAERYQDLVTHWESVS